MRFAVRFLRRRGRVLPWREVVNQAARIGDLRIEESPDGELHPYVRSARLFDSDSVVYSSDRAELLDMRITGMSPQAFTVGGIRARRWGGRCPILLVTNE